VTDNELLIAEDPDATFSQSVACDNSFESTLSQIYSVCVACGDDNNDFGG